MKKISKSFIVTLALVLIGLFSFTLTAYADDDGYHITSYDVDITVNDNATYLVHEKITCDFTEKRHGIKRYIPETQTMTLTDENGKDKKYYYSTPISDVNINSDYSSDYDGDYLVLQIGDADKYVEGLVDYDISYVMDIGDDRIDAYDRFYFDVIGPSWDTTIDNVKFNITFKKDCDTDKAAVYSGFVGDETSGNIEFSVDKNTISGYSTSTLSSNQAVTVDLFLPEGYFVNSRKFSSVGIIVCICVLIALTALSLVINLSNKNKDVVQTVEFYPPEGISSADVGYIIDHSADDKDLISLIIYFADKGYLSITDADDDKDIILQKLKNLPDDAPIYQKTFFNGLFKGHTQDNDSVALSSLKSKFYDNMLKAKSQLSGYFTGARKLSNSGVTALGVLLVILSSAMVFFSSLFCGGTIDVAIGIFGLIAAICLLALGVLTGVYVRDRYFLSKFLVIIPWLVCIPLYILMIYLECTRNIYVPSFFPPLVGVIGFICVVLSSFIHKFTDYKIEMTGKLMGLKQFIKTAELDRLKALVEENPSYFYNIMPYAYVFGLSDKWVKQFESIAIEPPTWYYGSSYPFSTYYFMNRMNRVSSQSMHQFHSEVESHAATKSSGSSSFGGGGGGFSGGGFGGGGGSSW